MQLNGITCIVCEVNLALGRNAIDSTIYFQPIYMVQINGLQSLFPCLIAVLGRQVRMMPITDATLQADIESIISPRSHGHLKDIQVEFTS